MVDHEPRLLNHRGEPIKRPAPLWRRLSTKGKATVASIAAALTITAGIVTNPKEIGEFFIPGDSNVAKSESELHATKTDKGELTSG